MPIDEAVIEELKAKYSGRIVVLTAGDYSVIVRKPGRADWKLFVDLTADPAKRAEAPDRLFWACVVYPDKAAVTAMLDDKPALSTRFGGEIIDLAGGNMEVEKNAC